MARRRRKTLKNYFGDGSLPTHSHFEDLVDSTLNMMDDGFSRSTENGIEIALVGDQSRLLSFFRDAQGERPDWAITCQGKSSSLHFVHTGEPPVPKNGASSPDAETEILTLTQDGNVGVQVSDPAYRLDVNGAIRSTGRFGKSGVVPADGRWQVIAPQLDGCHALEVIAGVGLQGEKKGRYALLHAVAMNTFHPRGWFFNFLNGKNQIKCSHAWYLSRADRLKLRWNKAADSFSSHAYQLELKTERSYGEGIQIQYSITELWFDPYMKGSKNGLGGSKP